MCKEVFYIDVGITLFTIECMDVMLDWPIEKQLSQYNRLLTLSTCLRSLQSVSNFSPDLVSHIEDQYQSILSLQPLLNEIPPPSEEQEVLSEQISLEQEVPVEQEVLSEEEVLSEQVQIEQEVLSEEEILTEQKPKEERPSRGYCKCILLLCSLFVVVLLIPLSSYTCSNLYHFPVNPNITAYLSVYCRYYERGVKVSV